MPDINDLLKPVPVAFDYATFRYYLELDILQDTAKFLDWVDINAHLGGTSRTTTITGTIANGSNVIVLDEPLPIPLLGGTVFTRSGGTFTTVGAATVGSTEVLVSTTADADYDVSYSITEENLPYKNAQPIYDAITDEVVLRMGYTHPTQVPEAKIREMMLLGRIEAWRAVARNTVTDVEFVYDNKILVRNQFHQNALRQWSLAAEDYNKEFGAVSYSNYSTPAVRTYSGTVKGRW